MVVGGLAETKDDAAAATEMSTHAFVRSVR